MGVVAAEQSPLALLENLARQLGYVPTTTTVQQRHKAIAHRVYNAGLSLAAELRAIQAQTGLPMEQRRKRALEQRWRNNREEMMTIVSAALRAASEASRATPRTKKQLDAAWMHGHHVPPRWGRAARGPANFLALPYALYDPCGQIHIGVNLLDFARRYFGGEGSDARMEYKSLARLRPGLRSTRKSWRGWMWCGERKGNSRMKKHDPQPFAEWHGLYYPIASVDDDGTCNIASLSATATLPDDALLIEFQAGSRPRFVFVDAAVDTTVMGTDQKPQRVRLRRR